MRVNPLIGWPRAIIKLLLYVAVTLVMFLPVLLVWALHLEKMRGRWVRFYYVVMARITGLRLKIDGVISAERPLLVVANHSSYLDIFVLGSLAPLSFTPKLEIRSWPLIGFFCLLADCVFVERKPTDMHRAQAEMAARINTGKVLVLFPEGTTGDGFHVKPFKSGFFNLIENHPIPVQPISIAYTHIDALPLSAESRDKVAWIGEATLVDHLWRLLTFPCVKVHVRIHPVDRLASGENRKTIAKRTEEAVRGGLDAMLGDAGVVS